MIVQTVAVSDLYRSTPVECLHTILLGPTKYFLKRLMDRLNPREKSEIEVKINSLDFSGIHGKINGSSICRLVAQTVTTNDKNCALHRYHNSLVGRDYKVWSQVGIFVVWPNLTLAERSMWLSLAKVHTYVASN